MKSKSYKNTGGFIIIMKYIDIIFCANWGYQHQAARVAEIQREYPEVEIEEIPGAGGVFDVIVDGKTIYSKKETGRFPEKGETLELIKKLI
jgi:selenoprotein W-related protein